MHHTYKTLILALVIGACRPIACFPGIPMTTGEFLACVGRGLFVGWWLDPMSDGIERLKNKVNPPLGSCNSMIYAMHDPLQRYRLHTGEYGYGPGAYAYSTEDPGISVKFACDTLLATMAKGVPQLLYTMNYANREGYYRTLTVTYTRNADTELAPPGGAQGQCIIVDTESIDLPLKLLQRNAQAGRRMNQHSSEEQLKKAAEKLLETRRRSCCSVGSVLIDTAETTCRLEYPASGPKFTVTRTITKAV